MLGHDEEEVTDVATRIEGESQSPVELAVIRRGAELMLSGIGRSEDIELMKEAVTSYPNAFDTQAEIGRFMAAYVRDVMQEEINNA